jgi:hypothetical protein
VVSIFFPMATRRPGGVPPIFVLTVLEAMRSLGSVVVLDARREAGAHHDGGTVKESSNFNESLEHLDLRAFLPVDFHGETGSANGDHRGWGSHAKGRSIAKALLDLRIDLPE